MICNNCGKENVEGATFCANCGNTLSEQTTSGASEQATQTTSGASEQATQTTSGASEQATQTAPPPTYYQNNTQTYQQPYMQPAQAPVSEEYKPISMWGYFGYEILFSIPCVGFILLLVFSFGGTKNVNLKNFARSYFCLFLVGAVIGILFMIMGGAAIIGAMGSGYYY